MKCSSSILAFALVIALSNTIGFGAILNVDGIINGLAEYDEVVDDIADIGTDYYLTGSDIKDLHWGWAWDPQHPQNPAESWYTLGMRVEVPPINTTGDGTLPFPTVTTFQLGIVQGGIQRYSFNAMMFFGNVVNVSMLEYDINGLNPVPVALDANSLQHAVHISGDPDGGLELAVKASKFTNLTVDPFDVTGLFEGGGEDEDDIIMGRVPEPTTVSMIVLGGMAVLARRRRKTVA